MLLCQWRKKNPQMKITSFFSFFSWYQTRAFHGHDPVQNYKIRVIMKLASKSETTDFINCHHYSPDGQRQLSNVIDKSKSKLRGKQTTNS